MFVEFQKRPIFRLKMAAVAEHRTVKGFPAALIKERIQELERKRMLPGSPGALPESESMTTPAGERCPRCGSVMKQSPSAQPGADIWTCVRCKHEKVKKRDEPHG